ncbi:hypothetical protein HJC23_005600 [Cyclotella cryptica]|uniref:Uncharacterized protein n=1 Tax=Cyclotella cryptica TaxID=29204 RepID=A0ABD3PYS5_9STRA
MHSNKTTRPDPIQRFEQKLQSKSNHGLLAKLRGGSKYIIPESMRNIGCRKDWYTELRREYDTHIYPKDDERSLKWVAEQRQRQGIYTQSPLASTPYDIFHCPTYPPEGYPIQWPVLDVLKNWSPDDPTPHYQLYQGLCVFDYRTELDKANNYRERSCPFGSE